MEEEKQKRNYEPQSEQEDWKKAAFEEATNLHEAFTTGQFL